MNFAGFLSVYILVSFLAVYVKCEFAWSESLSTINTRLYSTMSYIVCKFKECCNNEDGFPDIERLDNIFHKELFGQDIAHHVVINALMGHVSSPNPPKALVMSFHGPPGTGKTYVTQMIAKSFYKNGDQSKFYHFFNGRNDFPLQQNVEQYKEELRNIITNSLQSCERSMFVFDEVDKMPEGLLNVLVPFMDYNSRLKPWRFSGKTINTKQAIFIFLSNTGSSRITQRLLTLWEEGKQRHMTKLQDFEYLISVGAFNEKGGFYRSDTIDTNLIDHYVPFLPLEETHVKKCLQNAFINRDIIPTTEMIQEGLSFVIFGPPPHNLYATAGCKRLEQKVASIVYNQKKRLEL
ncbi:torsin-1A [Calliopsis andreniformis]|uniref:torsin-1A n=1 Tax=Calliopsis andreniformis TaxID=337506 RepID=UPI003FCC58DB